MFPVAATRSVLSLHMLLHDLRPHVMNQAVAALQHVLRIAIVRTGRSGE